MAYICIREPGSGKILCKLDPIRCIIEIQRRGNKTYVDLAVYGLRSGGEKSGDDEDDQSLGAVIEPQE